jgi:hypothetical protein
MKAFNICALGLILCAVPAVAGTIVIGAPPLNGNGFGVPFGFLTSGTFQQVYSAGLFNGAITIGSLDYYNTQYGSNIKELVFGPVTISLSTTAANWNTLSKDLASNVGSNNTEVFSGVIDEPWSFPDTLTINFNEPFTYIPADGNLLITMDVLNSPGSGLNFDVSPDYFDLPPFPQVIGMSMGYDGNLTYLNYGSGLVTGFGTESPIPEPSSLVLLGSGLLSAAGVIGRRLKRQVRA